MSPSLRQKLFIAAMLIMVVVLNIVLFVLFGSDCCKTNDRDMLTAIVVSGLLAMGTSCWYVSNKVFSLEDGRQSGAKAGAVSVLLSYPLLTVAAFVTLPIVSALWPGPSLGFTKTVGSTLLTSFAYGFGAMVIAFTLTVWFALPFGALVGGVLAKPATGPSKTAMSRGAVLRGGLFAFAIFWGAIFVSATVLPHRPAPETWFNESTLTCAGVSSVAAFIVWYFVMSTGESHRNGAIAGLLTALFAVTAIGPPYMLVVFELQYGTGGWSAGVVAGAVVSFFAFFMAGMLAVPISVVAGILIARDEQNAAG